MDKKTINKLSDIFAEAIAGSPEMLDRLSTLLGRRNLAAPPGKAKKRNTTMEERKANARAKFSQLNEKDQRKRKK